MPNVFVVTAPNDHYLPDPLPQRLAVEVDTIDDLNAKLSHLADAEVSVLLIDVLDQNNHPGNALVSVDGTSYYADIQNCDLY